MISWRFQYGNKSLSICRKLQSVKQRRLGRTHDGRTRLFQTISLKIPYQNEKLAPANLTKRSNEKMSLIRHCNIAERNRAPGHVPQQSNRGGKATSATTIGPMPFDHLGRHHGRRRSRHYRRPIIMRASLRAFEVSFSAVTYRRRTPVGAKSFSHTRCVRRAW